MLEKLYNLLRWAFAQVRWLGLILATVIGILMAVWSGPEVYESGCYQWLRISEKSDAIVVICQYSTAE